MVAAGGGVAVTGRRGGQRGSDTVNGVVDAPDVKGVVSPGGEITATPLSVEAEAGPAAAMPTPARTRVAPRNADARAMPGCGRRAVRWIESNMVMSVRSPFGIGADVEAVVGPARGHRAGHGSDLTCRVRTRCRGRLVRPRISAPSPAPSPIRRIRGSAHRTNPAPIRLVRTRPRTGVTGARGVEGVVVVDGASVGDETSPVSTAASGDVSVDPAIDGVVAAGVVVVDVGVAGRAGGLRMESTDFSAASRSAPGSGT